MNVAKKHTSVTSHTPKKEPPDERLIGFMFPGVIYKDKIPLDYVVDPKTGLMEDTKQAQWSVSKQDLRDGIEEAVIPPLFIWKRGRWLNEFEDGFQPIDDIKTKGNTPQQDKEANHAFRIWVCHGEGSPGSFSFRAYMLPEKRALEGQMPKHPMMWTKKEKEGQSGLFTASTDYRWAGRPNDPKKSYHRSWELLEKGKLADSPASKSFTNGYGSMPPAYPKPVKVPEPVKAPGLPTGVKFRCGFCGHWFTEHNLKAHVDSVCPGRNTDSDWAVMCDDKCGCENIAGFPTESHAVGEKTLDHPSTCKPGFPRPKKAVAKEAVAEGGDAVAEVAEVKAQVVLQ